MQNPDVIVLGVGHSGTSILARCLIALGWAANDADRVYCESLSIKVLNRRLIDGADPIVLRDEMVAALKGLSHPFAVKDPRFAVTLEHWYQPLESAGLRPALLFIRRQRPALDASYLERGERCQGTAGAFGRTIDELVALAEEKYAAWPFAKLAITYEGLVAAAHLVRAERRPRREGGLWVYDDPAQG